MSYKFYYTYRGELYGVIEYYRRRNVLKVELVRTEEFEEVWDEWLADKIQNGEIELFKERPE